MLKWWNRPTQKEFEILQQIKELRSEQTKLDMVDNFSKYSKIQRKINNHEQQLSEIRTSKNPSITYAFMLPYGLKIMVSLILFVLSIYFRKTPVFMLDEKLDFSPFNYVISYPNDGNAVSVHFFVICCTSIAELIKF